jgi:hypothetical protein
MDDVLIATSDDLEKHRKIVQEVLQMFREESFFLKLSVKAQRGLGTQWYFGWKLSS